MSTARPFAYNTGAPIAGTIQVGSLAIGTPTSGFTNNPQFWNGPDEELGYVIAKPISGNTQPTPLFNGAPSGQLTLSSTYRGSDINLSNGNQTAYQQFGYQQSVLGQTFLENNDKVMYSVVCSLIAPLTLPNSHYVGFGTTSMNYQGNPYGGFPGNDNQSIGFSSGGEYWFNGAIQASGLPTWTSGDTIDVAVDLTNNKVWVRVNGGNWNNNSGENPATGTGSLGIGGLTSFYPVLCPGYEGTMTIQNTATYGVPSGYTLLGTNITASVGFLGTKNMSNPLSEATFVELTNSSFNQNFTTGNDASTWLTNNGYWNSWVSITPTPTATLGLTPTPTITNTPTPTGTPSVTSTPTPSVTNTLTPTNTQTPTPTPTSGATGDGWFFYSADNAPVLNPPINNGNTTFIPNGGLGTYNPNYTGGTFNLYFNNNTSGGTSYSTQFSGLDTTGGTITISQGGSTAIYSGTSADYQSGGQFIFLTVTGSSQMIQSASTPFVSGTSITVLVNGGSPTPTPTATPVTPTPTPTSGASGNFTVTISQVGPDVVWNGSGSFNLAALTSTGTGTVSAGFNAGSAAWAIGPNVSVDIYSGVTTFPTSFGSGGVGVTSTSGSTFGILLGPGNRLLYVPSGYTSNTNINGSATYASQTITGMGLTPGTYTWSWGSGGNASSIVMTITP